MVKKWIYTICRWLKYLKYINKEVEKIRNQGYGSKS